MEAAKGIHVVESHFQTTDRGKQSKLRMLSVIGYACRLTVKL
jgi:hypothetical protein